MGDAFDSEPQGAFGGFLDWISHTGQIGMNVARGRPGAAAKHLVDFIGEIPDAFLRGDMIPQATSPDDYTSGGDLLGIDRNAHPLLGFGADIGVGMALDPLTWIAPGASTAAGTAGKTALRAGVPFTKMGVEIPGTARAIGAIGDTAKAGYGMLPQSVRGGISKAGQKGRLIIDMPRVSPENDTLIQQGLSAESVVNQAGHADVERLITPLPRNLREPAFDVANNLKGTVPGEYGELLPDSYAPNPLLDIIPNDLGDPLSDIARAQPAEDYLRVRDPGLTRPVDPMDVSLGIKQQPILDQAYPEVPTDPRFGSGIDVANNMLLDPVTAIKPGTPTPKVNRARDESLLRDEMDEPLTLYHGTKAKFDSFSSPTRKTTRSKPVLNDGGIYLTPRASTSDDFSMGTYAKNNPDGARTISAHVRTDNPAFVVDINEGDIANGFSDVKNAFDKGHDSVIRVTPEDISDHAEFRGELARILGFDPADLADAGGAVSITKAQAAQILRLHVKDANNWVEYIAKDPSGIVPAIGYKAPVENYAGIPGELVQEDIASGVKRYGTKELKESPSELRRTPTGADAIDIARAGASARGPVKKVLFDRSPSEDLMLSGMGPKANKAPSATVPSDTLNAVNEMQGGQVADKAKVRGESIPAANATFDTVEGHMARYSRRIDAMPISDVEKAKLKEFWAEALPHVHEQYARDVQNGIMYRPQGQDILREMPADYVQRRFTGMLSDTDLEMLGNPNTLKERTLKDPGQLPKFMNDNPDVKLERDIGHALGHRVEQDARMTKSAVVGKGLNERYAKQADEKIFNAKGDVSKINLTDAEQKALAARGKALADEEFRSANEAIIKEIKEMSPNTEDGIMLENIIKGLAPRGAFMEWLAYTNREFFKPFAVAGAGIAKVGTNVRNAISAVFMTGANPESRALVGKVAKSLPKALWGGLNDGIEELTGVRLGADEFADVEAAMKAAKGDPKRALAGIKDPIKREAIQHAVIDNGFIRTEDLLRHTDRVGWAKWLTKVRDWPAAFFKGVEQRLRYALFKGLRGKGIKPAEAARITRDSLYDYRIASGENRAARDLIPFFQFQAKAIPQTAKLMLEQPSTAVAMSQILQDRGDPVYPWMQGKTNIPLGEDEEGNDLYATGLGLPFEAMNMIPMSFRDVQKNVVGSSHPILKSLFAATSGTDPYFETPYGSYSKIPAIGEAGGFGQFYNKLAGTGMIQPLDSLLRVIGDATDERHNWLEKAADTLTGVNIASVDPDRALQQLLQMALEDKPNVRSYQALYDPTGDPETAAMLAQYQAAKKKVKAKREALKK